MLHRSFFISALALALAASASAQNAGSGTTQPTAAAARQTTVNRRTTNAPAATRPAPEDSNVQSEQPAARTRRTNAQKPAQSAADAVASRAVRAAFDTLVDGIRRADAGAVMKVYWDSPQLILFNNNGTVTKSWEQVRSNRESLYEKTRDVKLDVRDVRVKTLGPGAALVTCLWDQSQTADGQPEHAAGRLTLVFQKIGAEWKVVHAHTSPDRPNPSSLLPSERTTDTDSTAKPPAKP
jgi:uncharacterized protein (TIGR02246 family)